MKATLAAAECDAPVYLRLTGVMGSPVVYKSDYDFRIGKAIRLREGSDVLVFATGPMVAESMKAAKLLAERGVESEVVDVHTLKPLDPDVVEEACSSAHVLVATVEEHSVIGGLGSAVAGAMAARGSARPLVSCGVNDFFPHAAPYGGPDTGMWFDRRSHCRADCGGNWKEGTDRNAAFGGRHPEAT